jgi:hypothetical protein
MADDGFMTCMSVAFRVCICLAKRLPLHESESYFEASRANLQHHIFTMLRWVQTEPLLQSKRYTALVSLEMAEPLFEISRRNCYLLLAPYTPAVALSPAFAPMRDVVEIAAHDPSSTLKECYDLHHNAASVQKFWRWCRNFAATKTLATQFALAILADANVPILTILSCTRGQRRLSAFRERFWCASCARRGQTTTPSRSGCYRRIHDHVLPKQRLHILLYPRAGPL